MNIISKSKIIEKENSHPKIDKYIICKNVVDNDIDKKEEKKNTQNKKKLKFHTWEIINCIVFPFCKSQKTKIKYEIFKKASNYMLNYINIFSFIKKLVDIEKLKSILLNNHQITLFNYIAKPKISLISNQFTENDIFLKNDQNNNNENITQVIHNYYNELKRNGNLSLIDYRLYSYLDDDLKTLPNLSEIKNK